MSCKSRAPGPAHHRETRERWREGRSRRAGAGGPLGGGGDDLFGGRGAVAQADGLATTADLAIAYDGRTPLEPGELLAPEAS